MGRRLALYGAGTAMLVLLAAAPAAADPAIQITGMTCSTLSATGSGLPPHAELRLSVLDQDTGRVLRTLTATTSSAGSFRTVVGVRAAGVRGLRLVVAAQDGARIGYADHQMAAGYEMCPLPNTGSRHAPLLLLLAAGLLAGGAALLETQSYRGTHLAGWAPRLAARRRAPQGRADAIG